MAVGRQCKNISDQMSAGILLAAVRDAACSSWYTEPPVLLRGIPGHVAHVRHQRLDRGCLAAHRRLILGWPELLRWMAICAQKMGDGTWTPVRDLRQLRQ